MQFYVLFPGGFHKSLEKDLTYWGFKNFKQGGWSYQVIGDWVTAWKLNYTLRVASRILVHLHAFSSYSDDELYRNVFEWPWEKWINPEMTFKVHSDLTESFIKDSRFLSLRIKDAIADRFRSRFGKRPNVDKNNPDFTIWCKGYRNRFILAADTTGEPLFKRGWRIKSAEDKAHLKENLAAAIIWQSGWNFQFPFLDPFCGSGTLAIEAAHLALGIPGSFYRTEPFAFERWPSFDRKVFERIKNQFSWPQKPSIQIWASDISANTLEVAQQNATKAGVNKLIHWSCVDACQIKPPQTSLGWIVSNLPYDYRIKAQLENLVSCFMGNLRRHFTNWQYCLVLPKTSNLKNTSQKRPLVFKNGPLTCQIIQGQVT